MISTEPHGSGRVDRQLYGRAARQGDPGCGSDVHQPRRRPVRPPRPTTPQKLSPASARSASSSIAQAKAEHMARFNRKQILKSDDWMDESLPF